MRKNKLWLMPFLIAFVLAMPLQAFAAPYTDMKGHWAKEDVVDASGLRVFSGYPDGSFQPEGEISRAEFVTALVRAMDVDVQSSENNVNFQDVKPEDWFYGNVQTAIQAGYIQSGDYSSSFRPNDPISRGEMARMIARAVEPYANVPAVKKTFKDVEATDMFAPYVKQAAGYGIISGYTDGMFRSDQGATRAEAAVMMLRAMKVMPQQGPYNIKLQGVENAAGPSFAINQVMAGMRDIFNYEGSTDFSTLNQFADSKVVDQLEEVFRQFADRNKGMMLIPKGSPLLPKFISRTMAVVEQENMTYFKRNLNDHPLSGTYAVAKNLTWYLKFTDGKWTVIGVENFRIPDNWTEFNSKSRSIPPTVYYKLEDPLGTFYGSIDMIPDSEKYVMQNIRELIGNASPGKIVIYAIGEKPVESTQWAGEIKQLELNPPSVDHSGKVRFLAYQDGYDEVSLVWMKKEELAGAFYVAFTNTNNVQIISVDGVPWTKMWSEPLWKELIKNETLDTVFDNAPKYQAKIEKILQNAK